MNDFDALVAHVRDTCGARAWLYDYDTLQRRLIASTAAVKYGTTPVEPDTKVVRAVYDELRSEARAS